MSQTKFVHVPDFIDLFSRKQTQNWVCTVNAGSVAKTFLAIEMHPITITFTGLDFPAISVVTKLDFRAVTGQDFPAMEDCKLFRYQQQDFLTGS
jgi:hypothetical protein